MMTYDTTGDSLSTIQRGFQVIDVLLEREGAGPTEVAEQIDLPVTTVYEYLRSMSETKFVNRRDGKYYLSSYFITICGKMRHRDGLFQVAKREMNRIAEKTGELVGLTIEDNGLAVLFHQEAGEYALELGTYPGAATPLHTLANGKAILAHLPEDRLDEIIGEGPLEQRTEYTITDPEHLRSELSEIRSSGYAVDWDEQVVGISTPTQRLKKDGYREELLQELQEMQNTISINYQYSA